MVVNNSLGTTHISLFNIFFRFKLKTYKTNYTLLMSVIEKFVKHIEKVYDNEEVRMLENLWMKKITNFPINLQVVEEEDGEKLHLFVLKGAEAILLHKSTSIFLYITNLTSVELETLRYITIKKKGEEADEDFVSLAYEYISFKNKAKIGIRQ
ncbi:conserved hypothetical protein [Sulfolobus islandicus L.S.2.15]|uniref:Uncharacterized protein n=1 Tax=Saccharolobus islandicus (strain L.S.2.15 / Lassen \|nr:conserved hypothetical protein [Sulfolobus islandicus L.S.2.15]